MNSNKEEFRGYFYKMIEDNYGLKISRNELSGDEKLWGDLSDCILRECVKLICEIDGVKHMDKKNREIENYMYATIDYFEAILKEHLGEIL